MRPDPVHSIDAQTYFHRLGLAIPPGSLTCDRDLLNRLQYAHVTRIPYENLDILSGKDLPMTCEDQFSKMILGRRGGYCFELNGLFACLLQTIGYRITTYMGRYLRGETTIPMRRHRVIRTECNDGTFICDVGVGQQAPRFPLALVPDLVQEQFGETYKISREPFLGWVVYDLYKGQWRRFYSFTEEEQLDIDFVMPSFYCEKSPESIFNKSMMLSIKTEQGRKTIDGSTFRIFSPAGVHEEVISKPEQLIELMDLQFNLSGPDTDQARVWLAAGKSVR
ncbi:MAG: arylamine N-acetyltransferase [Bacillota bacterium]|nr:arylamine N-acetyltransferase [Bacillota bacterium]